MTVIRLYTKIINTSDFAGKLVQNLISKGYSLNVICNKETVDKFVAKKINTDNIHFSHLDKCSSVQLFNFDI